MKLGINGLGRIGKLTLWHHVSRKYFSEIVVNLGREVGTSFTDLAEYIEKDSTYGWLPVWLHGHNSKRVIENINDQEKTMVINGVKVKFLMQNRNPKDIEWQKEGVKLVVDCTGKFRDPTKEADDPKGSARGPSFSRSRKGFNLCPF